MHALGVRPSLILPAALCIPQYHCVSGYLYGSLPLCVSPQPRIVRFDCSDTDILVFLFICLSVCLSICVFVYLSDYQSVCLSIYLFDCLSVCLSVWLSICLFV